MAMGRVRGSDADTLRVDDSTDDGLRSPFAGTNGGLMHDGDDLLADDGASFPGIGDEGDSVEDPTVVLGPARPAQHQSDLKGKARDAALPAGQTPAGFADRELRFGGTMGMADRKANGDAPASVLTKVDSRTVEGERKFGDGDTGDGSPGDSAKHAALQRERDWLSGINDMLEKAADDFDTVKEKLLRVQATAASSHSLLDVYSRILTQTEHTHQLLRDSAWQGATADAEAANAARQRAADDLAEAQAQAAREAEERATAAALEKSSAAAAAASSASATGGPRGRGRGRGTASARGAIAAGRGAGDSIRRGAASGSASDRGSRIGRARGRPRGA